jgi:hypothetical protein
MRNVVIVATKALIVVLFAAIVFCQAVLIPINARGFAIAAPEYAALEAPGVIMVDALLLCGQVALICVWALLSRVGREEIFDTTALRWVDAIIGSIVVAGLLVIGGLVVLGLANAGSPFIALMGLITVICAAGLALVVVVLRGLLRQATQLRQDLSEVV